jgi:hypothetical protein
MASSVARLDHRRRLRQTPCRDRRRRPPVQRDDPSGGGVGASPTDEITAARERLEQARASGDTAAIEQATREADAVVAKIEGRWGRRQHPGVATGAGAHRQGQVCAREPSRVGIAAARRRDVEQHAAAIEAGAKPPKAEHERRADQKLGELERAVAAAALVEERCYQRMNSRIEEHRAEIASTAEARLAQAKHAYLGSLSELEQAIGELSAALAIKSWADDPSASYRLRGARPVDRLVGEPTVRRRARCAPRSDRPSPLGGDAFAVRGGAGRARGRARVGS